MKLNAGCRDSLVRCENLEPFQGDFGSGQYGPFDGGRRGYHPGQTLIGESMLFLEGMYAAEMLIVTESEHLLFSTSQVIQICNSLGIRKQDKCCRTRISRDCQINKKSVFAVLHRPPLSTTTSGS